MVSPCRSPLGRRRSRRGRSGAPKRSWRCMQSGGAARTDARPSVTRRSRAWRRDGLDLESCPGSPTGAAQLSGRLPLLPHGRATTIGSALEGRSPGETSRPTIAAQHLGPARMNVFNTEHLGEQRQLQPSLSTPKQRPECRQKRREPIGLRRRRRQRPPVFQEQLYHAHPLIQRPCWPPSTMSPGCGLHTNTSLPGATSPPAISHIL